MDSVSEIIGNELKILLLGSYDEETKKVLCFAKDELADRFQRYCCTTLLLENIDMFVSLMPDIHDYWVIIEKKDEGGTVIAMNRKKQPIEIVEFKDEKEFRSRLGKDSGNTIDLRRFRKVEQIEKVELLNNWADLVYLVRELESTRGGEVVELVYLLLHQSLTLSKRDPFKYEFFFNRNIPISSMIKEIVSNYKINPTDYSNVQELGKLLIAKTNHHISRLNSTMGRFRQFE
jgi:hypothetical protein